MPVRCLGASVVLLLTLSTPAWSQAGPDANPIEWLKNYLGGAACVVYEAGPSPQRLEHVTENTEVRFEGCRMVLDQATAIGTHVEVRTFTVRLAALDASAVTATDGFFLPDGWTSTGDVPTHTIHLTVPAGQPLIEERVDTFDDRPALSFQTRALDILIRHQENATQIVRALTLAIEACRGVTAEQGAPDTAYRRSP